WVVECQLKVTEQRGGAEVEVIRGGDCSLLLEFSVDGVDVVQPAVDHPAMRLPRFPLRGKNRQAQEINLIRDAVVDEFVQQHAADAWVQMLPAATWRETARLVFQHESGGKQFETRNSEIQFLGRAFQLFYGIENGMPFFGGPHGYGLVQVDYGANPVP